MKRNFLAALALAVCFALTASCSKKEPEPNEIKRSFKDQMGGKDGAGGNVGAKKQPDGK